MCSVSVRTSGSAATCAKWSPVQSSCDNRRRRLRRRLTSCSDVKARSAGPKSRLQGSMNARIDHLVVAADSLEQGVAWCEGTLGVQPAGGGKHPLMGTHNRLLAISSERFADCYLEIIAIDPAAAAPARARWFGLDDPALREALRERPRLVHAVARTQMIEMLRWGLINCGLNPGE